MLVSFTFSVNENSSNVFTRDVTASMLVSLNKGTSDILVNSILMQTIFVLVVKHAR